jgi:hypothetical protein
VYGRVTDLIFVLFEMLNRIAEVSIKDDTITLSVSEKDNAWYFIISSNNIPKVAKKHLYIAKNLLCGIDQIGLEEVAGQYIIEMKKKDK